MTEDLRSGEVELDLDDLRALARVTTSLPVKIARIAGPVLLVVSVVTFALSSVMNTPYAWRDFLWVVGAALLLLLFGSEWQRAHVWRWQLRRSPGYGPQTYAVADEGFTVASSKARTLIDWSAVQDVQRDEPRLFVFVNKSSAYVIPRRAFSNDTEFHAFAEGSERLWRDHKAEPAT